MTREEAKELALSKVDNANCLVLQLGTGFGKQYKYFTYPVVYFKNSLYLCTIKLKHNRYGGSSEE